MGKDGGDKRGLMLFYNRIDFEINIIHCPKVPEK